MKYSFITEYPNTFRGKDSSCNNICSVVKCIKLTNSEIKGIEEGFDQQRGINDIIISMAIKNSILPRFKQELDWSNIRAIKCRANDHKTFIQRYNSDCHRDRHLFGGSKRDRKSLALNNYSSVIYLDKAVFRYIPNSSVTSGKEKEKNIICNEVIIEPGMAVLFPSSIIHQARASYEEPKSQRRTIVLFDIENPDNDDERIANGNYHNIIVCPKWTQWAFFHNIFTETHLGNIAFKRLIYNRPYSWRYVPYIDKNKANLVHWQVTLNTAKPDNKQTISE